MPVKSIAVLKTFFETGDRPTESQFADLIDSFIHKTTGSVVTGKSVDVATGDVLIQFSDGDSIGFNVSPLESAEINFINGLQEALNNKVDKENGKALSSNDFTNELREKLENLQQVTLPTSYEIDFINGLQEALNSKANNNEVVKSINFDGSLYEPDLNGNVILQQSSSSAFIYDLSTIGKAFLNYTYLGDKVYGILLEIPEPQPSSTNYQFAHNLNIKKYLKAQFVEKELSRAATNEPDRQDLNEVIIQNAGLYNLEDNEINCSGYAIPDSKYLYLEYTENAPISEGISSDEVGVSAIGIDD